MKQLLDDDEGSVKMVGSVVGILVTLIVAILVFFSIAGNLGGQLDDLDDDVAAAKGETGWPATNSTEATNATNNILSQSETFFTIASRFIRKGSRAKECSYGAKTDFNSPTMSRAVTDQDAGTAPNAVSRLIMPGDFTWLIQIEIFPARTRLS